MFCSVNAVRKPDSADREQDDQQDQHTQAAEAKDPPDHHLTAERYG